MARHEAPTRRTAGLLLAFGLVLLPALLAPRTAAAAGVPTLDQVFGSVSMRSDSLQLFPKWRGALARYFAERQVAASCTPGLFSRCDLAEWEGFLEQQQGQDALRQLDAVNRHINEHRYIIDPRNWGVEDYWATPLQFFDKDGDCEDYAIAKFMSLRALGWTSEQMRIVVVNDMNLKVQHAVLVVALGDAAYVLDNQSAAVMPAERIRHYRPVYSINEDAWWLHRS